MTRKDYELIAEAMRYSHPTHPSQPRYSDKVLQVAIQAWCGTVNELTSSLRSTNPRFDSGRFNAACQPKK